MMNRRRALQLLGLGAAGLAGGLPLPALGNSSAAKHWVWMRGEQASLEAWRAQFAKMRAAGIGGLLLQKEGEELERLLPIAQEEGLEVHAWFLTMLRGEMAEERPDWYAVNREGVSTAEDPPYVDYYKFLSPCVDEARAYVVGRLDRIAQTDGLAGIHLDYIRFPDVILPITLQPTYGLVQDREYPPFDYGYHTACRALFEKETGTDPVDLDDPAASEAWVRFRQQQITNVVKEVAEVVKKRGKMLTAAVFPTPAIARRLVRQDWPAWPLDAVMPMIYHNFYEEPVAWIEAATRAGIEALGAGAPLYSGLFVPELTPKELAEAAAYALDGGASGVAIFDADTTTDAHWTALKAVIGR